jgi:hypothetical protein
MSDEPVGAMQELDTVGTEVPAHSELSVGPLRPLSLDLLGGLLAVVGLGGVIYALTEASARGWGDVSVVVPGLIGIGALAAVVPVEWRRARPMLRLSLFRSRQFDAINAATLLFYGALAAASYLVVLQCELRLGYSATRAGAALIPESTVFLLVSPFVGGLVARLGTRWLMTRASLSWRPACLAVGSRAGSRMHEPFCRARSSGGWGSASPWPR